MNIISNKSEKSLSKRLTVVVLGLALIASGFVVPANTEAQSATSVLVQFNRDLTMGSTGTDVAALQTILIEKGFLNIPLHLQTFNPAFPIHFSCIFNNLNYFVSVDGESRCPFA